MWTGKTVFIIGGGSSIPQEFNIPATLVDRVQQGIAPMSSYGEYMKPLHNEIVIGVNAAYKLGDWLNCVFFGDDGFYTKNQKELKALTAEVVTCNKRFKDEPGITYIPKDNVKHGLSKTTDKLRWNDNSGAAAINLAVNRGAKRIILLGFDMQPVNGQTHFHKEYIGSKPPTFHRHLVGFKNIALQAAEKGVEILNCSQCTALKEFPVYKLSEIIKMPLKRFKIGIVIPTCSPERKPLLDFVLKRMKEQTLVPDVMYVIDYPNRTGGSDINTRYQKGIEQAFADGCDLVFFIEDDDYYPRTYIQEMTEAWKQMERPVIIGCGTTVYYHVGNTGYKIIQTPDRSSAFSTAVAPGVNYKVGKSNDPYYDIRIWKENKGVVINLKHKPIGIKHGLGVCGGGGHQQDRYELMDTNHTILKRLVDAEAYSLYDRLFFNKPKQIELLAISFVYNELKYLPMVISYYQQQGCQVYVIDNMSTDGTYEWLLENNIPCHRHDTQEAFQLEWLQTEMIKTIHLIKPKWFLRFDADMFQMPIKGTILEMVRRADKAGCNQVRQRVFRYRNTGEEHHVDMYNHYRYAVDDKTNICFITKYNPEIQMRADHLKVPNGKPFTEGIMLEYGGCKPKDNMNEKLKRREKAWKLGTPLGHGTHYREGVKKNWTDKPETLTDTWKDRQGLEHIKRLQAMDLSVVKKEGNSINIPTIHNTTLAFCPTKDHQHLYTVIIPTMWASNYIFEMLDIYERNTLVKEVIIIDNEPTANKDTSRWKKVRKVTKGKNIYVNPAWNWGVSLSNTHFIIIANDDILMEEDGLRMVLCRLRKRLGQDMMVGLGADCFLPRTKQPFQTLAAIDKMNIGYGTFMIMQRRSYVPIPEDLLIWRGDVIQWERNKHYQITGIQVQTPHSTTIKREGNRCVGEQDLIRAKKYDFQTLPKITV